jgi:hypothetical protein
VARSASSGEMLKRLSGEARNEAALIRVVVLVTKK